jgi:hypothetical protein
MSLDEVVGQPKKRYAIACLEDFQQSVPEQKFLTPNLQMY